jgi:hypothetical protein
MPVLPSFWLDSPDSWNRVALTGPSGTYDLPGVCVVAVKASQKIAINVSPLQEGASYVPQGNEPPNVEIVSTIWQQSEWNAWVSIVPDLLPPARRAARPVAFAIDHPATQFYGIRAVIVTDITGPEVSGPGGYGTVKLSCRAYLPLRAMPLVTIGAAQSLALSDGNVTTTDGNPPSATQPTPFVS